MGRLSTAQGDLFQFLNDKDATKIEKDFLIYQALSTCKALGHDDIADMIDAGKIKEAIDALDAPILKEARRGIGG